MSGLFHTRPQARTPTGEDTQARALPLTARRAQESGGRGRPAAPQRLGRRGRGHGLSPAEAAGEQPPEAGGGAGAAGLGRGARGLGAQQQVAAAGEGAQGKTRQSENFPQLRKLQLIKGEKEMLIIKVLKVILALIIRICSSYLIFPVLFYCSFKGNNLP